MSAMPIYSGITPGLSCFEAYAGIMPGDSLSDGRSARATHHRPASVSRIITTCYGCGWLIKRSPGRTSNREAPVVPLPGLFAFEAAINA
jgi:hypothetical protein